MTAPPDTLPSRKAPAPRRLSTAQTLSLLTAAVVVAVLVTAMTIVWLTLTRSDIARVQDRMDRGVRQLAVSAAGTIRQREVRYNEVARDAAILAALRRGGPLRPAEHEAVRSTLELLRLPTEAGRPAELWDASGRRLAFVGEDVHKPIAVGAAPETSGQPPIQQLGIDSLTPNDSLHLGTLYRVGERTYYWSVFPVMDGGRVLGFLATQQHIATNPQAERTIRELSGTAAAGFYRNIDGSVWTTFGGVPAVPPDSSTTGEEVTRRGQGPLLHAAQRVPGTPLAFVMEVPRQRAVERANAVVRRLAVFSALLALAAMALAWLVGRRVTRPLAGLTDAAESVARGDYSTRVPGGGSAEISRLASSFNRMASEIGESRASLEAREADLQTLANTIPQLAWMADTAGGMLWLNERWYAYTGDSDDRAYGEQWTAAHDPAMLPEVLSRWQSSVRMGTPFEMEVRLRGADGSYRWFLTRVAPVPGRDGRVTRWFGTSTDIQALREARDAADAGNRAKSDFLAAMSHELRTPLNAIGGYAELIELGIRGPVSDAQRRDLARIRACQAQLLSLIGGVLDLSRIEYGRVTYDVANVALHPVLDGLEALILPQAKAKRQRFEYRQCGDDLVVLADGEKLRQILLNLLSNAVRHSPVGASITLAAARHGGDCVAIEVSDTGAAIPEERQEAIFEPFVQLDRSLTSTTEGVGLGLTISRDLARGMSGDLMVRSTVGEGNRFTLVLPEGVPDELVAMLRSAETRAVGPRP